jgi:hypothetical protein
VPRERWAFGERLTVPDPPDSEFSWRWLVMAKERPLVGTEARAPVPSFVDHARILQSARFERSGLGRRGPRRSKRSGDVQHEQ